MGDRSVPIFKSTPYLPLIAATERFGSAPDVADETFRCNEPLMVAGVTFLTIAAGFPVSPMHGRPAGTLCPCDATG
jgi:ABC-type amino acid transport system permease subunit